MSHSSSVVLGAMLLMSASALGAPPKPKATTLARFALVVGVNRPLKASGAPLRFADDDAIAFARLFRPLAKVILLVEPDADSRRLHPTLRPLRPTRSALWGSLRQLRGSIAKEKALGRRTVFYLIYSGHGDVGPRGGYLTLADGTRFTRDDLAAVLGQTGADMQHVIIDACKSYFLVNTKRAGGQRRSARRGFDRPDSLVHRFPNVGFLLSTSSAASSHEWARFQAGVFSHEVRSALAGGGDLNRDGEISYSEISAFISVANRGIRNVRFRPQVFARPPRAQPLAPLLRWGRTAARRITIPAKLAGRYFLEDRHGVRVADIHAAPGHAVSLHVDHGRHYFLHDLRRRVEYAVSPARTDVMVNRSAARERRYTEKGAAHEAFEALFTVGLGRAALRTGPLNTPSSSVRVRRGAAPTSVGEHALALAYQLFSPYTAGGSLLHGIGVGYRWSPWARAAMTVSAGYATAFYTNQARDSRLHDVRVQGGLRWRVLASEHVRGEIGASVGMSLSHQRSSSGGGPKLRATRTVGSYRAIASVSVRLWGGLWSEILGRVGHDIGKRKARVEAELALAAAFGMVYEF